MVTTDLSIKKEKIFDLIINEIKRSNLTPLECYMYLYNLVKHLKEYKKVPEGIDCRLSRESIYTLFNEYISCVGYTTLLVELANRIENPNLVVCEYGCSFVIDGKNEVHSRCLVKIVDDEYGVNGIYISDPTFDSVKYHYCADIYDMYNHFLLTKAESLDEKIYDKNFADVTDIFFQTGNCDNDDNFDMDDLLRISKIMFGKEIVDYNDIPICINSELPYQTIRRALFTIYSKVYTGDKCVIESLVERTMKLNSEYQELHFDRTKYKFSSRKI